METATAPATTKASTAATENGKIQTPPNTTLTGSKIREHGKSADKPRFLIDSDSVINTKSEFRHKKLCHGFTLTTGHACTFRCAYCYVPGMMKKNKGVRALPRGLRHQDVSIELSDPVAAVKKALAGRKDAQEKRTIFGSPLVDVAATSEQADATSKVCLEILEATNWDIRLLSKSAKLADIAHNLDKYRDRIIFGWSTGTLDENVASSIEQGASPVSARLQALRQMQKEGFRTYAMLCPVLPQIDYTAFANSVSEKIDIEKCEHVWSEVLNPRGNSMRATCAALRKGEHHELVNLMASVAGDKNKWDNYAEAIFVALSRVVPAEKLRFLQYVNSRTYPYWENHVKKGAVLLGAYAKFREDLEGRDVKRKLVNMKGWSPAKKRAANKPSLAEVNGETVEVVVIEKLSREDKILLQKNEAIIQENNEQFKAVCRALAIIHCKKLYREKYSSFEAYCAARFDFSVSHGKRLATAGEVILDLEKEYKTAPIGAKLFPETESQARELAPFGIKDRVKILQRAVEKAGKHPLTAILIQHSAAEVMPEIRNKLAPTVKSPKHITDLNIFIVWLAKLKKLAQTGQNKALVAMLEKAELAQEISQS